MSADSTSLVPATHSGHIPIARMRAVYRLGDVEKRLDKLPGSQDHEHLRATYNRMLEKGADRFQVKPSGLPAMEHLYDELPNFTESVKNLLDKVNETQVKSSNLQEAYQRGEDVPLTDVVLGMQKSSLAFEATLQVRNKVLRAYEEIMNMPV